MEPLKNKFLRFGKDRKVKTFEQVALSIKEPSINEKPPEEVKESEPLVMPELRKGSKGEIVKKAQRILKLTSDYIGYVDGDFGGIMESGLKSFQRRHKLPVTGIIDSYTWDALNKIRQ
ncbi:MAG: peptidoglycan-binding domain-containing protein [Cyanobacteria bacterium P01_D01_bin.50]